jgi:hypothetical protein
VVVQVMEWQFSLDFSNMNYYDKPQKSMIIVTYEQKLTLIRCLKDYIDKLVNILSVPMPDSHKEHYSKILDDSQALLDQLQK